MTMLANSRMHRHEPGQPAGHGRGGPSSPNMDVDPDDVIGALRNQEMYEGSLRFPSHPPSHPGSYTHDGDNEGRGTHLMRSVTSLAGRVGHMKPKPRRTSPIFDLPPEVLDTLLNHVVEARDIKRMLRLRLVSKALEPYVIDAIYRNQRVRRTVMDQITPPRYRTFRPSKSRFLANMHVRAIKKGSMRPMYAVIRKAVDEFFWSFYVKLPDGRVMIKPSVASDLAVIAMEGSEVKTYEDLVHPDGHRKGKGKGKETIKGRGKHKGGRTKPEPKIEDEDAARTTMMTKICEAWALAYFAPTSATNADARNGRPVTTGGMQSNLLRSYGLSSIDPNPTPTPNLVSSALPIDPSTLVFQPALLLSGPDLKSDIVSPDWASWNQKSVLIRCLTVLCCLFGNAPLIRSILVANPTLDDDGQEYFIRLAARGGHSHVVAVLLDLQYYDPVRGCTGPVPKLDYLLCEAAKGGDPKVLDLLLEMEMPPSMEWEFMLPPPYPITSIGSVEFLEKYVKCSFFKVGGQKNGSGSGGGSGSGDGGVEEAPVNKRAREKKAAKMRIRMWKKEEAENRRARQLLTPIFPSSSRDATTGSASAPHQHEETEEEDHDDDNRAENDAHNDHEDHDVHDDQDVHDDHDYDDYEQPCKLDFNNNNKNNNNKGHNTDADDGGYPFCFSQQLLMWSAMDGNVEVLTHLLPRHKWSPSFLLRIAELAAEGYQPEIVALVLALPHVREALQPKYHALGRRYRYAEVAGVLRMAAKRGSEGMVRIIVDNGLVRGEVDNRDVRTGHRVQHPVVSAVRTENEGMFWALAGTGCVTEEVLMTALGCAREEGLESMSELVERELAFLRGGSYRRMGLDWGWQVCSVIGTVGVAWLARRMGVGRLAVWGIGIGSVGMGLLSPSLADGVDTVWPWFGWA